MPPPNYAQFLPVTALPDAAADTYGRTFILQAEGHADRAFICRQNPGGAYIWFEIVPPDPIATQAQLDELAATVLAAVVAADVVVAANAHAELVSSQTAQTTALTAATNSGLATAQSNLNASIATTAANLAAAVAAQTAALNAAVANYRVLNYAKTGVNMAGVGDTLITGLPAKYRVESVIAYSGSVAIPTVARIALYTGPGATGTAILAPVLLALPLGEVNDFTIAGPQQKIAVTGGTLYLRVTQAFGSPATASFQVTVRNLA